MNHKQFFTRGFMLVMVVLLTACAAPKATLPTPNAWRSDYTGGIPTNVTITFDPGDKCSMKVITPISGSYFSSLWNQLSYDIVVNDQTYQNYVVWVYSADPGTTQAEMDATPKSETMNPPSWINLIQGAIVYPMSRTFHYGAVDITEGPLYFTCMVQGPDALKFIGFLGPLEVPTK
jgi:hypothetical protein